MENMETGFVLMGIGMTTVFIILLIVIYLGKGLIALVNKYALAEESAHTTHTTSQAANGISETTLAVIISAVSAATQGKGKVIRVEKL